ncbi:MAG: Maf family protein [Sphaerochaetaceae bacterium]
MSTIILASNSVARKALLEECGYTVIVDSLDVDESYTLSSLEEIVIELAKRKLDCYLKSDNKPQYPVLTADTLVVCENRVLGKSKNAKEAKEHLLLLSGKEHYVYSGYALYIPALDKTFAGYDKCGVTFRKIYENEIDDYLKSREYEGAAASYRIQQRAKDFVLKISGDINTVIGLPLNKISAILRQPHLFIEAEYPPVGEK